MIKGKMESLTDKLVKMSTWKIILIAFIMAMIITFF